MRKSTTRKSFQNRCFCYGSTQNFTTAKDEALNMFLARVMALKIVHVLPAREIAMFFEKLGIEVNVHTAIVNVSVY